MQNKILALAFVFVLVLIMSASSAMADSLGIYIFDNDLFGSENMAVLFNGTGSAPGCTGCSSPIPVGGTGSINIVQETLGAPGTVTWTLTMNQTGTPQYGDYRVNILETDGLSVSDTVEILLSANTGTNSATNNTMGTVTF